MTLKYLTSSKTFDSTSVFEGFKYLAGDKTQVGMSPSDSPAISD